ncbi:MAG: hypothetical protein F3740_10030 [Nitrospinae bacterium]|nr:hypothetical protein [Nitrospinota bacterium]
MSYLIDWIGFRLSKTDEPFLMLDPFISYKEEVIKHLEQFESQPYEENEMNQNLKSQNKSEKKPYE